MIQEDIINKNNDIILKSIALDNKEMYLKIKKEFPALTTVQVFVILLIELKYSVSEILLILGVTPEMVEESKDLVKKRRKI